MHEDVHINISSNTWNGYTAENQEERLFSTRQHSYFGVTHYENSKVQKSRKEIFGDRPPPRLSEGLDDRTPPPPYLKVWNWSLTRMVFKLGSKVNCVCYRFATPHCDFLTKHGPLFQQKRSKTKTNRDLQAHALALCASMVHVIASNSGWFMSLFAPVVIGYSSYFGFGFKNSLDQSLIQIIWLLLVVHIMKRMQSFFSAEAQNTHFYTYRCSSFKVQAASFCKQEGYHFCILISAIKIVYWSCVTWPKIARNFGIHMTSRLNLSLLPLALSVWLRDSVITIILMSQFMIKT